MIRHLCAGVALAASLLAQTAEPQFKDYPAPVSAVAAPAAPKFKTAGQRKFRSVIRDAVDRGVNFAGHYTVAEWGCGTGCVQMAVVDALSGDVYEGPFGNLPRSSLGIDPNVEVDKAGLFYQRDSTLLVARGCPNSSACGAYYYQWTGNRFKRLKRVLSK